MADRQVITGERFWESLRSELARTRYSSVREFTDRYLPQIVDEFATRWERMPSLELDEPVIAAHVRVALFEGAGWRFWVTGIERPSGAVELDDIDIETWERPQL